MSTPLLVCYLPNGAPVLNYAPDERPLAHLHAYLAQSDLAQPDEAQVETPTVFSLPLDAVQEEALASTGPTRAEAEAGRQPSTIVPHF